MCSSTPSPHRQPLPIVLIAILEEGKILLLRRAKDPYRGYWSLPGGKIHFGETIPQAACREAWEETGLSTSFLRCCGIATETIRDESGDPANSIEAHFLLFFTVVETKDRSTLRSSEEGELRWFSLSHLEEAEIIPTDRSLIQRYLLSHHSVPIPHYAVLRKGASFTLETILS